MSIAEAVGLNVFVGFTLAVVVALLLALGRRRAEDLLLAFFLSLVSLNFLANGIAFARDDITFSLIGRAALALDPFFLVAFVTAFPYARRGKAAWALMSALVVIALCSLFALFAYPEVLHVSGVTMDLAGHPARSVFVLGVAVGYAGAWLLAVRGVQTAPTAELARRSSWVMVAVGVVTIPRLALVPVDLTNYRLGLTPLIGPVPWVWDVVPYAAIMGAVLLAGMVVTRVGSARRADALAWGFRVTGAFLVFLVAARFAELGLLASGLVGSTEAYTYTFRWLVFSAILLYGVLAYEMVSFSKRAERGFTIAGALVGGAGVFALVIMLRGVDVVEDAQAVATAGALSLAALAPAALASRASVRAIEQRASPGAGRARRLELYRAALEAAWAKGAPSLPAREQLEHDRRAFGLSYEEARTLEHVVASRLSPRSAALEPGEEPLPGLVLDRLLGQGGQGRAYLAHRYEAGDTVVVKVLDEDSLGTMGARRGWFDELRPLLSLDHPNIVRLLEAQATDGRFLLVFEHADGTPLAQRLEEGPLSPDQARSLGLQLLDALETAHANGILHRDVKPGNALLDEDGHVTLMDFGTALLTPEERRVREATVTGLAGLGGPKGTLAYMAPEQAREEPPTPATDLYQVALVLHEALTGRPALDLHGLSTLDALARIADPPIDHDAIPPTWRPILTKALDPDPAQRYEGAPAMREALLALPDATTP